MSIESNIAASKARGAFLELAGEIIEPLSSEARARFWQLLWEDMQERFPRETLAVAIGPGPRRVEREDDAVSIAEEIIELAEDDDLPERAQDFAESVADKARDILESIEEHGSATDGQREALENMLRGLKKWFR